MNIQELTKIREAIVNDVRDTALSGGGDPANRLQVLLEVIRSGGASADVFKVAYGLVKEQSDDDDRLGLLLDLLYEADIELGRLEGEKSDQADNEEIDEKEKVDIEVDSSLQSANSDVGGKVAGELNPEN